MDGLGANVDSDACGRLWSLVDVCPRLSTVGDVVAWWHGGLQGVNPLAPGGMFSQPDDPKGSMDLEAPGIEIVGFGSSRHQNRWIWRLQASESMDL